MTWVRHLLLAAVLAGTTGPPAGVVADRSFSVRAAAFPVEPAPGLNQTSLGARPAATRASLSNPPAASYGRAAAYDLGTIELYTGPPPPESVAECDTASPNIGNDTTAEPAGMKLTASCSQRPAAEVSAARGSYASGGLTADDLASRIVVDGGGDVLTASATVSASALTLGPLVVTSVSTRGTARAGGTPGTAAATGRVEASGASVNGIPVIVGADGVEVDEQRVPLELVPTASKAVRDALGQGGYADVRLVQPATSAAADGTSASVTGGGLMLFFNRNDPAQNYFVRVTFGGVALAVDVGPSFADLRAPSSGGDPSSPPPTGAGGGLDGTNEPRPPAADAPTRAVEPGPASAPVLTATRSTYDLPRPWRGWTVLLALLAGAAAAGWLSRRRLAPWWDANADRYLRG